MTPVLQLEAEWGRHKSTVLQSGISVPWRLMRGVFGTLGQQAEYEIGERTPALDTERIVLGAEEHDLGLAENRARAGADREGIKRQILRATRGDRRLGPGTGDDDRDVAVRDISCRMQHVRLRERAHQVCTGLIDN